MRLHSTGSLQRSCVPTHTKAVSDPEGVRELEPHFETKLFHIHGEILEKSGQINK